MQYRKIVIPVTVMAAALAGYIAGYATKPAPQQVLSGHFDDFSMVPSAAAQENKPENKAEVLPFGYNSPRQPALAPDAPPTTYWNIDDIKKAHGELAEKAAKLAAQAGSGGSQSIGGGPVHIQTRNFSMFMLYRMHREQPVPSLTKVNSVWDDAEMHAGAYDFYVITGGTGEMIVGGKIANRQNLMVPCLVSIAGNRSSADKPFESKRATGCSYRRTRRINRSPMLVGSATSL
jgi:hypothetical protein